MLYRNHCFIVTIPVGCRYRRTIWFGSVIGSGIISYPDIAGLGEHKQQNLRRMYFKGKQLRS
jgi:hypothetical protein